MQNFYGAKMSIFMAGPNQGGNNLTLKGWPLSVRCLTHFHIGTLMFLFRPLGIKLLDLVESSF